METLHQLNGFRTARRSWGGLLVMVFLIHLVASDLSAQSVEPLAGTWKTWIISSGKDYRVPAPPGSAETSTELKALSDLMSFNNARTKEQISFWSAGSPAYRWMDLISERQLAGTPTTAYPHRVYAYVAMAMYDAMVAAW